MNWDPWTGCYKISEGCTYCYYYGPYSKRCGQNIVEKTIKKRPDLDFLILTKRIDRFPIALPDDWGDGYENVNIGCTVENQEMADYRLPLFLSYPMKRRFIAAAPLLGPLDLSPYLSGIEHITIGGETGREARICDYDWVLDIREQCVQTGKTFWFKNTGSFFKQNGIIQKINPFKQNSLAKDLGIDILDHHKNTI